MDLRRKLFWVSVLYFAEGFPFGVAIDNLPVYFRLHGVSLTEIGLMSLLGAPWTLKVLWAPLVDRFGTHQHWFVSCLVTLALVMGATDAAHHRLGNAGHCHRRLHHRLARPRRRRHRERRQGIGLPRSAHR
jgi:hypothetical protein